MVLKRIGESLKQVPSVDQRCNKSSWSVDVETFLIR